MVDLTQERDVDTLRQGIALTVQAAEQTADPTAVRAAGQFNSDRCTQIDEEPYFVGGKPARTRGTY